MNIPIKIVIGKIAPPPPEGPQIPAEGRFMRILHDYQANDGLVRVGMPEVLSMYLNRYTELTSAWQWFWFRQMIHAYTNYAHWDESKLLPTELGILKAKWRSLTKSSEAFTNFKGTNRYRDYITPNSLSGTPGQEPLCCGGNIAKVIGEETVLAGQLWTPVETLDGTKPPPDIAKINRLTRPDLIPVATNIAANKPSDNSDTWTVIMLPNGTWRVDPFPQLQPRHTPFCLRTNGKESNELEARKPGIRAGTYSKDGVSYAVNYILSRRLGDLQGTLLPNPFNPPQ